MYFLLYARMVELRCLDTRDAESILKTRPVRNLSLPLVQRGRLLRPKTIRVKSTIETRLELTAVTNGQVAGKTYDFIKVRKVTK